MAVTANTDGEKRPDILGLNHLAPSSSETFVSETITLQGPEQPRAKMLYEYWLSCEHRDGLTFGRDFPAKPIMSLLKNILVFQPIEGDYVLRVTGNELRRRFGRDPSRQKLTDLFSKEEFAEQLESLDSVRLSGKPSFYRIEMTNKLQKIVRETQFLPAWSADRSERWLLGALFYVD